MVRAREVGGDCEERGGVDRLLNFKSGSRRDAAGQAYGRVERAAKYQIESAGRVDSGAL